MSSGNRPSCVLGCGGRVRPVGLAPLRPSRTAASNVRVAVAAPRQITEEAVNESLDGTTAECPFHAHFGADVIRTAEEQKDREIVDTPGPEPTGWEAALDVSRILFDGVHEAMLYFFEKYGPVCRCVRSLSGRHSPMDERGRSATVAVRQR